MADRAWRVKDAILKEVGIDTCGGGKSEMLLLRKERLPPKTKY